MLRPLAIFYSDGSIVECGFEDDEQVEITFKFKVWKKWLEAPKDGVQAIVQKDPIRCRHVLRGQDYFYAMPDGMLHAADPLAPYLNEHLNGLVKYGVCLSDNDYRRIMQVVKKYNRIPRDCARTETEQDDGLD